MGYFVTLYALFLSILFTGITVWMWRYPDKDGVSWFFCIMETVTTTALWSLFIYCIYLLMTVGA